jgi:hypothetical protein
MALSTFITTILANAALSSCWVSTVGMDPCVKQPVAVPRVKSALDCAVGKALEIRTI